MTDRDDMVLAAFAEAADTGTGWYRANCPICVERTGKDDRRRSFAILAGVGVYLCWKCGVSGRIRDVPEWFAEMGEAPDDFQPSAPAPAIEPPEDWTPLWEEPGSTDPDLRQARRYLKRRGISRSLCEQAKIGACLSGLCRSRIVVPILGDDGETWLGWVARWFEREEPMRKYLYPLGMPRGSLLYQQHLLTVETAEPVLVVEGVFDALPYWGQAVAVLGKPSHNHLELLAQSVRPLVICLDGDAWEEAEMLCKRLRLRGKQAGWVKLPPRTDPATVDHTWLQRMAQTAALQ